MARCKEELRAQGVTALPRTCPEHGITCPVGPSTPALQGQVSRSCATCRHGELAHGFMLDEGPQPGCRAPGCECKGYADPYAKLTLEPLPTVIPKKSGVVAQLPKTFGDLRKLVRGYDEGGIPDSAKIQVTRASDGSDYQKELDGNVQLRLLWWTVKES